MAERTCSVEGCERIHYGKGYCEMHYLRWRTHGDPEYKREARLCSIDGCNEPHAAKGYCQNHYSWAYNHGTGRVCGLLKKHDRDLADDPEALDRTFLSELVGIDCDYDDVDIAEFAEGASRDHDKEEERDKLAAAILDPLSEGDEE